MKTNTQTQTQHAQHELWNKLLEVERIDGRSRKLDASVQPWVEQLAITDNLVIDPIPVFNWLVGVKIYQEPDGWLEMEVPNLGTFGRQRYAEWLERWLSALLTVYKSHHVRIVGLKNWQYPPLPLEKETYSEDDLIAIVQKNRENVAHIRPRPGPGTVPWAFLHYTEMTNELKKELMDHIKKLPPDRAKNYCVYLTKTFGYPAHLYQKITGTE